MMLQCMTGSLGPASLAAYTNSPLIYGTSFMTCTFALSLQALLVVWVSTCDKMPINGLLVLLDGKSGT